MSAARSAWSLPVAAILVVYPTPEAKHHDP